MKKVYLAVMLLLAASFSAVQSQAQGFKVGVFDIEMMVQAMPGYGRVDSLAQIFDRDSLQSEYQYYQSEYQRLDSTYKSDSARKVTQSVLNQIMQQRQQVAIQIVYWEQIARRKSDDKRGQLAQPLYEAVARAYEKVLLARKYDLVLKPNSYEMGSKVENVFAYVAKELKIQLPQELGGGQAMPDDTPATKPATGGGARPAAPAGGKRN